MSLIVNELISRLFFFLSFSLLSTPTHYKTPPPSNLFVHLPAIHLPHSPQLNDTALDWSQISKKECLSYGGSLVGSSCRYVPDLALVSFILFFGTYSMTVSLKRFKFSRYFPTKVRQAWGTILEQCEAPLIIHSYSYRKHSSCQAVIYRKGGNA